jgi:hypothetical protein
LLFLLDGDLGRASPGDSALSRRKSDTANARKYIVGLSLRPGEPNEGPTQPLVFWSKGTASNTATMGATPQQVPSTERTFFVIIHRRAFGNENSYKPPDKSPGFGAGAIIRHAPHGAGDLETELLC